MASSFPKRSEDEILVQILRICADSKDASTDKLHIMNAAFLPDREAGRFLARLVADRLLTYSSEVKRYTVTNEGLIFLKNHGER